MECKEEKGLLARIEEIKQEISGLGEMRCGSLREQYNVCGSPKCKCKDKENPRKHGPYYQLSYTHRKKNTSEFVSKENVAAVQLQVASHQRFIELKDEWIDATIELTKLRKKRKVGK